MKFGKFVIMTALAVMPLFAQKEEPVDQRLQRAATVFSEIMAAPDKGIPRDLLDKAECAIIIPGLKAGGFIVAAKYGKGFITCRKKGGVGWSAPGAVIVEGGSVGFQIGASDSDVVMLVMNDAGVHAVLSSQYTMGGHAEVAAGPVGRSTSAQTSGWASAGILSWARSHGIFAGVSLTGASLRQDTDANEQLYGKKLDNSYIVTHNIKPPKAAAPLLRELNKYSPRETK